MSLKKLLTAQEVADIMDKPVHAVWRMARENVLPFTVRLSPTRYRFDPDGLEAFIKSGGVSGASSMKGKAAVAA